MGMLAIVADRESWVEGLAVKLVDRICHWIQPQIWEKMQQAEQAKRDYDAGLTAPGDVGEFKRGDGGDMRRIIDEHIRRGEDGQPLFVPDEGTAAAIRKIVADAAADKGPQRVKHAWHLGDGDGQTVGNAGGSTGPVTSSFYQPTQTDVDLVHKAELANRAADLMSREQGSNPAASILASAIRDSLRGR